MKILITGGAGFIGSALIRKIIKSTDFPVLNVDKLTYAGNEANLNEVLGSPLYQLAKNDICDEEKMFQLFEAFRPTTVIHLAAESHVDRSIKTSQPFLTTNVFGTYSLLEASRRYLKNLPIAEAQNFLFYHVSTDEVYGDLDAAASGFTEDNIYNPSSPYSASKASSDHFVRAWARTYDIPFVISNCSNNYGPYQHPEKLIPNMIIRALRGQRLPVYGDGNQIRDWLFVEDHADAILRIIESKKYNQTYNVGGETELKNIEVIAKVCEIMDTLKLRSSASRDYYENLIEFVPDRLGHDKRYSVDISKIKKEIGWQPSQTFETGLEHTVVWYANNQ